LQKLSLGSQPDIATTEYDATRFEENLIEVLHFLPFIKPPKVFLFFEKLSHPQCKLSENREFLAILQGFQIQDVFS
jgi:hypothetical protein